MLGRCANVLAIPLVVGVWMSQTIAIVELRPELEYELRFHGTVIAHSNADVAPGAMPVITYLGGDAALVEWQGPSQGCLDYGFTIVRLHADGTFARADVQHCARLEPELVVRGGRVILTSPAYRTFDGDVVPAKTWTL